MRLRGAAEPLSPRGSGRVGSVSPATAPLLSARLAARDGGHRIGGAADAVQVAAVAAPGPETGVGGVPATVGAEGGEGGERLAMQLEGFACAGSWIQPSLSWFSI